MVLTLTTLIAVVMSVAWARAAFGFGPFANSIGPLAVTLVTGNHGVAFGTAAINSDGSIAKCFNCVPSHTFHISGFTGAYQVGFNQGNITANSGFYRSVQVDTLSTGQINGITCSTADRSGDVTAVFIQC